MTEYAYLDSVNANATQLNDITAVAGTAYYYRLRAYNMAGNSNFTTEASALIPASSPVAPAGVMAHWDWGQGAVHITWTDRSNNEEYFYVERKAEGETAWQQIAELDQNVVEYYDSDVSGDTIYHYRIKASNPVGYAYSGSVSVYVPAH